MVDKQIGVVGEIMPFFVTQQRMAKKMRQAAPSWNSLFRPPSLCFRKAWAEISLTKTPPLTNITSVALSGKNSPKGYT